MKQPSTEKKKYTNCLKTQSNFFKYPNPLGQQIRKMFLIQFSTKCPLPT